MQYSSCEAWEARNLPVPSILSSSCVFPCYIPISSIGLICILIINAMGWFQTACDNISLHSPLLLLQTVMQQNLQMNVTEGENTQGHNMISCAKPPLPKISSCQKIMPPVTATWHSQWAPRDRHHSYPWQTTISQDRMFYSWKFPQKRLPLDMPSTLNSPL